MFMFLDLRHQESILLREKRELENFNEEYPTSSSTDIEKPSFWDKIVNAAIKLFSRFVEWLNSS